MLKRKIYDDLLKWKESKNKECLLVKGARQVGKTYIIEEFGRKEYETFIEINFYIDEYANHIFESSLNADEILKRISANTANFNFIPYKTLLFLDEIQACPKARTALKFLAQRQDIDVIASGSLLGLKYGKDNDDYSHISIPVGYERQIVMYSLDFEEFLWACGYGENAINYLKEYYDKLERVPDFINDKYEELVREYMVVGGMPEVVLDFISYKDFNRVQKLQEKIIDDYNDDITHHAKSVEKMKVRRCFDSIPKQLARENKKFKFSEVEKGSSARKYLDSIDWLKDANLIYFNYNISTPLLPLKAYKKENEFKIYLHDIGLLCAMCGFLTKKALLNNTLTGSLKAGLYENFIGCELIKKGFDICYFKPDDSCELEFIIEHEKGIIPIEVKAGNSSTKSLNDYINKYSPNIAYKYISGNIGTLNNKITLPHYMILFINK